jgi:L-asparaginase
MMTPLPFLPFPASFRRSGSPGPVPWSIGLHRLFAVTGLALLAVLPVSAAEAAPKPKVHILATGGTISGVAPERIMLSGYKAGSLGIGEMLADVPEIHDVADITWEQVSNIGSGGIDTGILLTLARRINALYAERPDVHGVVVTHGTGTMEETAYFLNLTVLSDKPVVCVGAMRPWSAVSGDGPLNLYNAVRVAASGEARGKGAMVVLNDEITAARDATKTDTYRVETFSGREFGYLGYADPDKVVFYRRTTKRHTFASEFVLGEAMDLPRVEIVYGGYQEAGRGAIDGILAAGVDGIVVASGASGFSDALKEAVARGIPVVYSDRKGQGRVLENPTRLADGFVTADNLRPQKARILLRLALMKTRDPVELQRIFNDY